MTSIRTFGHLITLFVIAIILALIAGQVLGQPTGLSYVETDSMSPTMEPGDGFIAIPTQVDNSIQEGNVIVFQAKKLHGGGLTTHRVVDKTERGYITRGDANPFTDQDGDEPPVKEPQIVAKALQVNDETVVIPYFGTLIEGIQSVLELIQRQLASVLGTSSLLGAQGLAYLFFGGTVVWYAVGEWRDQTTKHSNRDTSREVGANTRLVVGFFAVLLVLSATVAMVGPAGTQEYEIVSAEFESDNANVIPTGDSKTVIYPVDNGGIVPIVTYLEPASKGVEITPHESHVQPRSVVNASLTLQAPPETGYYRRFVTEHRYLGLLPTPVIRSLYAIHPWAPIVAIDTLIGVPFYLFGVKLVGTGRIRDRTQGHKLPFTTRLRRLITSLYR
jgi:signal peptidase